MQSAMNYKQAVRFLQSLEDYEKSPGVAYDASNYDLRRMEILLGRLSDPHKGIKTIHIAGTKGKGSTAAMISSALSSAGYRTGLFTSPHLVSWQERIALNGRPISQKSFARLMAPIARHVYDINREAAFGKLTTFEVVTALAFSYFHEKNADFQVLETGMGGRLDSTNVVDPDVCIITSISLDHTQVLGGTLAQIAGEKAGIIKSGCVAISAPQSPRVMAVIREKCAQSNVKLIRAGVDITWEPIYSNLKMQRCRVHGRLRTYDLKIPLLGDFQMENAAVSIAALEVIQQQGYNLRCTDIVRGFGTVKWPARMQVLTKSPLLIVDGAHNSYSMGKIIESLKKHISYKKAVAIFGCSKDKDIGGMAAQLAGFADRVIITGSSHPRAAAVNTLVPIFKKSGLATETASNPAQALSKALSMAGPKDVILATGSLFLAADILTEYKKGKLI
ncbi:MAG: bifunctional folylpolyglutamate synthase/dihydrofolate synthase [Dehalococcoidia bacterium]